MDIWLLSADYFFSSQLQGNLQRLGLNLRQANNSAELIEQLTTYEDESVIVIDLTLPELSLEIVPVIRSVPHPPKAILAFGPHVAEGKLKAAEQAGCDQVLTRGQAHRELAAVLQRYVGG